MTSSVRDVLLLVRNFFGRCHIATGSSGRVVCGPSHLEDTFLLEAEVEDEIQPLYAKIQSLYDMLELPERNGFCFGLLDPISNITVNSVIAGKRAEGEEGGEQAEDMAMRSLSGLLAFLTYLFPYLPIKEAVRYLYSAEADPIVASILIIRRRGMIEFDPCSSATMAAIETALRCAAAAAQYLDPQQLVLGWKRISLHLYCFSRDQPPSKHRDFTRAVLDMVDTGASTPNDSGITVEKPWYFAMCRLANVRVKELPPSRAAMKRMLLSTIHGFYLQALARFPTTELCARYHRSLLMGGYCYGPLDPTSNIIVNTLWYEQRFPSTKDLTLQMISTECLWRIAARSLYGLVSFLCTRYPALTPDLALQRVLVARADLRAADPNLLPAGRGYNVADLDWSHYYQVGSPDAYHLQRAAVESSSPSASAEEAYAAAATAAFHPYPDAQREFLGSESSMHILGVASELLQHDRIISLKDIEFLSQQFRGASSMKENNQQQEQVSRKKSFHRFMSDCNVRFWEKHQRVLDKVKTALDTFNKDKEFKYQLHVICGVNELVSGPDFSLDMEVRGYNPWTPFKYHHSHINFLATCGGSKPTLFFAECGNHETAMSWCIPVELPRPVAEHVRCIYCEFQGNKIVHPAVKGFHGRGIEFEKLLRGEAIFKGSDQDHYNNNKIISETPVDWVHSVRDEYIYFINANTPCDSDDDSDKEDCRTNMG